MINVQHESLEIPQNEINFRDLQKNSFRTTRITKGLFTPSRTIKWN